jgi:biotin carboxyl carrier protein
MTPEEIVARLRDAMRAHGVGELSYRDSHTSYRLVLEQSPESAKPGVTSERPATSVIPSPEAGRIRLSHPLRSRKAEAGQVVAAGEPIFFIESDGRLFAVESRTAGRIAQLLVRESQLVDYGAPLILLESP